MFCACLIIGTRATLVYNYVILFSIPLCPGMGKRKLRFYVPKYSERKQLAAEPKLLVETETASIPSTLIVQLPLLAFMSARVDSSTHLRSRVVASGKIPTGWVLSQEGTTLPGAKPTQDVLPSMLLYKPTEHQQLIAASGLACSVSVMADLSWAVCVGTSTISKDVCEVFEGCSSFISSIDELLNLLDCIDKSCFCVGNADEKFKELVASHKGQFFDSSGMCHACCVMLMIIIHALFTFADSNLVAVYDTRALPTPTIHHKQCPILVHLQFSRCASCTTYRRTLHAMVSNSSCPQNDQVSFVSSRTNYRFLSTPEKIQRMKNLHKENRLAQLKISRLELKLSKAIEEKGISLEADLSDDFKKIMAEEEDVVLKDTEPGSFKMMFWEQQKLAAQKSNMKGMRWHPAMIRFCLFLRHQSSKAYETIRESGCISLPSQRTLCDYTQCVKSTAGFSAAVDRQLAEAAKLTMPAVRETCCTSY